MQFDQKQLFQLAQDNPCWMFTGEEIAELCNVSQDVITRVKATPNNPFFLNKCRPEWFLEWMRQHPNFQLTKADPQTVSKKFARKRSAKIGAGRKSSEFIGTAKVP